MTRNNLLGTTTAELVILISEFKPGVSGRSGLALALNPKARTRSTSRLRLVTLDTTLPARQASRRPSTIDHCSKYDRQSIKKGNFFAVFALSEIERGWLQQPAEKHTEDPNL